MRKIKLLNQSSVCVKEAVEGILLLNSNIISLEEENILFRSDIQIIKQQQVTLLSGGGSGHEPAHAGYIGDGMLSGAILGNVFASPSIKSILNAIRVAGGLHGVLLIVKNYTGDRLNFGVAAQRAKAEGIQVEMVLVDDDCALHHNQEKGITGSRGVAGTVLIHKIIGAAARRGLSLLELKELAQNTIKQIKTLGAALSLCSIPGSNITRHLSENSIEMSIGIHGESGKIIDVTENTTNLSQYITTNLINQIIECHTISKLNGDDEIVVLVNNLGGISQLEMLVFIKDVIEFLQLKQLKIIRCYTGTFMTSLEMAGVSITIYKPNSFTLSLLDETTTATAWIPSQIINNSSNIKKQKIKLTFEQSNDETNSLSINNNDNNNNNNNNDLILLKYAKNLMIEICYHLIKNEPILTQYDLTCGDGDCGLSIKAASEHILNKLQNNLFIFSNISSLCSQIATSISESMGGTSGVLLEIMFRTMSSVYQEQYLSQTSSSSSSSSFSQIFIWSKLLKSGVESISLYGGATEGMRTMLDSLIPVSNTLISKVTSSSNLNWSEYLELLQEIEISAKIGMEKTKELESLAGRSNYISQELLIGTPDPGAYAIYLVFQAINSYFQTINE